MADEPTIPVLSGPDHDLLLRLDTKFDILIDDFRRERDAQREWRTRAEAEHDRLWEAIGDMREQGREAKGVVIGARWVWAAILALPPTLVSGILLIEKFSN